MTNNYIQNINNDITFEQAKITKSYLSKMINYYSNLETQTVISKNIIEEKEKLKKAENELKNCFPELFLL